MRFKLTAPPTRQPQKTRLLLHHRAPLVSSVPAGLAHQPSPTVPYLPVQPSPTWNRGKVNVVRSVQPFSLTVINFTPLYLGFLIFSCYVTTLSNSHFPHRLWVRRPLQRSIHASTYSLWCGTTSSWKKRRTFCLKRSWSSLKIRRVPMSIRVLALEVSRRVEWTGCPCCWVWLCCSLGRIQRNTTNRIIDTEVSEQTNQQRYWWIVKLLTFNPTWTKH